LSGGGVCLDKGILGPTLAARFHSEFGEPYKKHYTKGGPMPGNTNERWFFSGDVLGISKKCDAKELLRKESAELNNGRLAMIAIMGFSAAATIPGSVPF
jgi:hypothetical protein